MGKDSSFNKLWWVNWTSHGKNKRLRSSHFAPYMMPWYSLLTCLCHGDNINCNITVISLQICHSQCSLQSTISATTLRSRQRRHCWPIHGWWSRNLKEWVTDPGTFSYCSSLICLIPSLGLFPVQEVLIPIPRGNQGSREKWAMMEVDWEWLEVNSTLLTPTCDGLLGQVPLDLFLKEGTP